MHSEWLLLLALRQSNVPARGATRPTGCSLTPAPRGWAPAAAHQLFALEKNSSMFSADLRSGPETVGPLP
jgi:hypothetical protein